MPSANDLFANAIVITGTSGSVTGDNSTDLKEAGEPDWTYWAQTYKSVWYKWVAPATDHVTFHMFGVPFSAVLAAYTGAEVSALTEVNSNVIAGLQPPEPPDPPMLVFAATAGTTYYIQVSAGTVGGGGAFTLRWATHNAAATDWFSAAGYWTENNTGQTYTPYGGPELLKAPNPTLRVKINTPTNPALTRTDNPGGYVLFAPGATYWYFYPKLRGQTPTLADYYQAAASDPSSYITPSLPYRDPFATPPALQSEYLSPGLFSLGAYIRPVFSPGSADVVSIEAEFMISDGTGLVPYPAPILAALSPLSTFRSGAGTSEGYAMHGFVPSTATYPYAPEAFVLGVHTTIAAGDARTDRVYVDGAVVREIAHTFDNQASVSLSVRTTVDGSNMGLAAVVSNAGYITWGVNPTEGHGGRIGLEGCKYVYQAQVTSTGDTLVSSQATMLTHPYRLGPEPSEFWTAFINSAETLRIAE